jgi:hypothetical protein
MAVFSKEINSIFHNTPKKPRTPGSATRGFGGECFEVPRAVRGILCRCQAQRSWQYGSCASVLRPFCFKLTKIQ